MVMVKLPCFEGKAFRMKKRSQKFKGVLLGAHFSIAGGLHKAVLTAAEYGCPVLQIFTKNANTWKERKLSEEDIEPFLLAKKECGIKTVCSHTAYLLNLASPDRNKFDNSLKALQKELTRSSQLDISDVVLHPGAHMGSGADKGLQQIAQGINRAFDRTPDITCRLLIETTAGQGSNLGCTFEQLAQLVELTEAKEKIGFCFDTCHVFAAGYDLRTEKAYRKTIKAFDKIVGLDRLFVIHLNDAKKGLGSRVDRHEHIGKGAIGIDAFGFIMNDPRLKKVPKILETPKKKGRIDCDRVNLKRLRTLIRK
jgi:deoxyribonuclease-4